MSMRTKRILYGALAFALFMLCLVVFFIAPPRDFPQNAFVIIPADSSAASFAAALSEAHLIRSPFVFRALARVSGYDRHLDTGAYVFDHPITVMRVLHRIGTASHGIAPVRVTLTEGMTSFDMAETFAQTLPGFDRAAFLTAASSSEGYLFPETYFFMPGDAPDGIVAQLTSQFASSTASITPQIRASGHTLAQIVTMASILEREGKTLEDKRVIAGILWRRMAIGMPLQVDAAFGYAHRENGYTPTAADLQGASPYNTYRNRGLTPTPISNPGLDSLLAAATPSKSKYLYYLTGTDGKMHYAATFDGHKANRAKYLP